jgi:hypothetical protein
MSAKRKVEIELDIPEGYEVDRYDYPKSGEHFINGSGFHDCNIGRESLAYKFVILKPVEPPLELETDRYLKGSDNVGYSIDGFYVRLYVNDEPDKIQISNEPVVDTPAEARDLAKILNYWADNGKLPERVVVKELPKQGGE